MVYNSDGIPIFNGEDDFIDAPQGDGNSGMADGKEFPTNTPSKLVQPEPMNPPEPNKPTNDKENTMVPPFDGLPTCPDDDPLLTTPLSGQSTKPIQDKNATSPAQPYTPPYTASSPEASLRVGGDDLPPPPPDDGPAVIIEGPVPRPTPPPDPKPPRGSRKKSSLQSSFLTKIRKIYISSLLILASIFGFYIITQTTDFYVQLQGSPALVKYPLYVAVCVFALVIFIFIFKLLWSWLTLRKNPQVSLGSLSALSCRRELQDIGNSEEARDEIYAILDNIKVDEYAESLKSMNFTTEKIEQLADSREYLCKRYSKISSMEWINQFNNNYLTKLNHLAEERIKYYSWRGGVAATISNIPTMDRVIVLSAMFGMVKDLLTIYNVAPSNVNTTILLSKVIISTFCAGYAQEGAEKYGNLIGKSLEKFKEWAPNCDFPLVDVLLKAGATVASLGAEFAVHGFIIERVGYAAQKMLVPIVKE